MRVEKALVRKHRVSSSGGGEEGGNRMNHSTLPMRTKAAKKMLSSEA